MVLKKRVMTALGWSAGSRLVGQVLTWALTIFVIRLLSPEDYGLLAMAMIFIGFSNVISGFGLGQMLIQAKDADEKLIRQTFGFVIAINVVLCVVLYNAAPYISNFFGEGQLTYIVRLMSLKFLILTFELVPRSLLSRQLNFKSQSLLELMGRIIGGVSTLLFALQGFEVLSLVYGMLIQNTVKAIGINYLYSKWYWPRFSLEGAESLLKFGGLISLERALTVLQTQLDSIIIGKLLGKELLGFYAVAMHLASLPMQRVMGTINPIALSAFSKVQSDAKGASYYFRKVIRVSSFLTFPVFWGISAVAPELVDLFLGDKWEAATLPLQVLCLIMPVRAAVALIPSALKGMGRPDVSVINIVISILILAPALFIGSHWGLLGVCVAWITAYPLVFILVVKRAGIVLAISLREFVGAMLMPAFCAFIMYACVGLVSTFLLEEAGTALRLGLLILSGAGIYALVTWVLYREAYVEALNLVGGRKT